MNTRIFKYFARLLAALFGICMFVSCSAGDDMDSASLPEYHFIEPCLDWGCSKEQIMASFPDNNDVTESEGALFYRSQEKDELISYAFKNGKLHTAVVIPDKALSVDEILLAFKGYTRLDEYDNPVYINRETNTVAEITENDGFYLISWSQLGLDRANAVDLGLSVKWADVNLDLGYDDYAAPTPEDMDDDFMRFMNALPGWGDPTGVKKETLINEYPTTNSISGTVYDVAKAKWGGNWRIATQSEFQELITACVWTWTNRNGRSGYQVLGPSGNSIFLPVTGYRVGYSWYASGIGYYWTGTMMQTNQYYPYALVFSSSKKGLNASVGGLSHPYKYYGCAIRPVLDE